MNHLAHFYLSFEQPDWVLGNFAGDFVKGDDWRDYPLGIQQGILLHRAIDSFTDSHPATHHLADQLRPFAGRFSGPVSDIVRDHLLSLCWASFSDKSLREFADIIYNILKMRLSGLPEILRKRTPRMIESDWLLSYGPLDGLGYVLGRFQERLAPHPLDVPGLLQYLEMDRESLCADFRVFFPDLVAEARQKVGIA